MFRYLVIFLVLFTASCSRLIAPVTIPIKDSTSNKLTIENSEVDRPAKPDSSLINALIKCDSSGRAYLAQLNQLRGERVNQSISQQNLGKDLKINIKASDNAKEKIIIRNRVDSVYVYQEKPAPLEVPIEVNKLTGWQWFQIWLGRILTIVIIIINLLKRFLTKT